MVKSKWKEYLLRDIGIFRKGSGISRDESQTGTIPAVRYGEIYTTHHNYVRQYKSHISEEVARRALQVKYGDILFACSGETKEDIAKCVAIVDEKEVYAGGDIIVLSPTVKTNPIFLGYILNTADIIRQRAQLAQGDAIVHISVSAIQSIMITMPEYEEQCSIATALSDIDALITNLEKLIAKKKAIKQGAMQELLTGKRRLPGFDGEWKNHRLKSILVLQNGYAFKSTEYDNRTGKYSVITIANVQKGHLDCLSCNMVKVFPSDLQSHQILSLGDILISLTGNVGRVCVVSKQDCLLNQRVGKLSVVGKHSKDFIFHVLNTPAFLNSMIKAAKGGAQPNLGVNDIYEYEISLPPTAEEENDIAKVLSDMDNEIFKLQQQLDKYRFIKSGMMSELLTGRIRLV